MDQENRTEKASEKKRRDERRKGNVAKSTELNSSLILLAAFLLFSFLSVGMLNQIVNFMVQAFTFFPAGNINMAYLDDMFRQAGMVYVKTAGPFLLCSAVVGLAVSILQVRFVFSFEYFKQAGMRLNPISGFKRFFMPEAWIALLKNLLKAAIIGFVLYKLLQVNFSEIMLFTGRDAAYVANKAINFMYQLGSRVALIMLIIAVFDYLWQKFRYEKKIMMTKYEVKMEHKQQEGDPLFKSRRRSKHMQVARLRMMKDVPGADVVVTNPTMYAVALKYKTEFNAPQVVAKGIRLIAKRIKDIAHSHQVPVVENVMVAQTVYKNCEVGQEIPPDLYKAVAEILAYVYKMNDNYSQVGLM